jgi:hypothetical protein
MISSLAVTVGFATAAANTGAAEGSAIGVSTALLILVAGGLAFCIKAILDLRRRVADLETGPTPGAARRPETTATADAAAVAAGTIPPETLAVLVAAVHVTLSGRARLVAVTPLSPDQQLWSIEGRRQVFQSHILR